MKQRLSVLLLMFIGLLPGYAQPTVPNSRLLDGYVQEGLQNNLTLKQEGYEIRLLAESTKEIVSQARHELSKVDQQVAVAEKSRETARAYFNFLFNRDLAAPIRIDSTLASVKAPATENDLSDLQQALAREDVLVKRAALDRVVAIS